MGEVRESPPIQPVQPELVVWLYGLSGAGKSTLAGLLERRLQESGRRTVLLDGDVMRAGLCSDLGFSAQDRRENIRRVAQVARLFSRNGTLVIASFITPTEELRQSARGIVGPENFVGVFLRCSYEVCAGRDVKGLYAKARQNQVPHFTGKDSPFEEPEASDLVLDTAGEAAFESFAKLEQAVMQRLTRRAGTHLHRPA